MGDEQADNASASAAAETATAASTATGIRAGLWTEPPAPEAPATLNDIRFPCLMNMDYHAAREALLDTVHRVLMFVVIIAGAAALTDFYEPMKIIGPVIGVISGTLDLTFDLSNRARTHAMLRRRYSEILSEASRSPDQLALLQCRLDELSGEEEPPFVALLALCSNRAQQMTYGKIINPCDVGMWPRLTANFWRFTGKDFNAVTPSIA